MPEWATLQNAVLGGFTLGAAVSVLFAMNQKTRVEVLKETNNDYKDRNKQLEDEVTRKNEEINLYTKRIDSLEQEKRLPLDELTKLIMEQHLQQMQSSEKITSTMSKIANQMATIAKHFTRGAK